MLAPEEIREIDIAQVLQQRFAQWACRLGQDLDLRVGLQRALYDFAQLVARRVRKGDQNSIDLLLPADLLKRGGCTEHGHRAERATGQRCVVVDESDDGAERASVQLERERYADISGSDDDRPRSLRHSRTLTLESKETGLETNPSAPEQDQERGNRWRAEEGQGYVRHARGPGELECGNERANRDCGDDSHRLFDGRVPPNRPVEADDCVEGQLRCDRNQEIRQGCAHAEGHCAGEPREICQQPGAGDDAEVEHPQARRSSTASDPVHRPREACARSEVVSAWLGSRRPTQEQSVSPRRRVPLRFPSPPLLRSSPESELPKPGSKSRRASTPGS